MTCFLGFVGHISLNPPADGREARRFNEMPACASNRRRT